MKPVLKLLESDENQVLVETVVEHHFRRHGGDVDLAVVAAARVGRVGNAESQLFQQAFFEVHKVRVPSSDLADLLSEQGYVCSAYDFVVGEKRLLIRVHAVQVSLLRRQDGVNGDECVVLVICSGACHFYFQKILRLIVVDVIVVQLQAVHCVGVGGRGGLGVFIIWRRNCGQNLSYGRAEALKVTFHYKNC